MKRIVLWALFFLVWNGGYAQQSAEGINFIVVSDMGRRGESEQQNIADLMGRMVEKSRIDFVVVAGDPIHDEGVRGVDDEEWKLKFENVYTAESLQKIPWHVISGNHEYRGSVQAILDYSQKSERWNAPARYFSMEYPAGGEQKILLVFVDTSPLIDKYRQGDEYSDAGQQSIEKQLQWLDSTLVASSGRWKIVVGHHPVYAETNKSESERTDMQSRIGTIIEKRGADAYICGHIHNFQYIQPDGKTVHYIVNSSASQSRKVKKIDGTKFCSPDPGFTVCSASADKFSFSFVNHKGETIYDCTVNK